MPDATTDADLRDLVCLTMVSGVGPLIGRALRDRSVWDGWFFTEDGGSLPRGGGTCLEMAR
jgi:hypothetical protein